MLIIGGIVKDKADDGDYLSVKALSDSPSKLPQLSSSVLAILPHESSQLPTQVFHKTLYKKKKEAKEIPFSDYLKKNRHYFFIFCG